MRRYSEKEVWSKILGFQVGDYVRFRFHGSLQHWFYYGKIVSKVSDKHVKFLINLEHPYWCGVPVFNNDEIHLAQKRSRK